MRLARILPIAMIVTAVSFADAAAQTYGTQGTKRPAAQGTNTTGTQQDPTVQQGTTQGQTGTQGHTGHTGMQGTQGTTGGQNMTGTQGNQNTGATGNQFNDQGTRNNMRNEGNNQDNAGVAGDRTRMRVRKEI
jgi:hypothetical protein